jgi:DNA-binding GntR family transcriptional regulator
VAGNPLVVETMGLYWNHLRRAMAEVLRHAPQRSRVWDEHEGMLKGIIDRDPQSAERFALQHARDASRRVAESIPATPLALRDESPSAPRGRNIAR